MNRSIVFSVINDLTYDQRMSRICATLAKSGYKVTLVGRKLKTSVPLLETIYAQHRMHFWFRSGPVFYLEFQIRLLAFLLKRRFDVYCACDLDTALPNIIASGLRKKPSVFDAHEFFTEVPELKGRNFVKRIWTWIGNISVQRFTARYTVNTSLAKILAEKYSCDFSVIRNVPDYEDRTILTLDERDAIILYQGALNTGRGLEQVIKAMEYIYGYTLHLVGEGDLSKDLRSLVKSLNLENKVLFLGRLQPAELTDLTAKATIGLNLLDDASLNYVYSLANRFFDYMHAGLPSVNMEFPEYKKILDTHPVGITVRSIQPEDLGRELEKFLADREKLKELIRNCKSYRVSYRWQEESKILMDIINGLF